VEPNAVASGPRPFDGARLATRRNAPHVRVLHDRLVALGRAEGLDAVGTTTAEPFFDARAALHERKAAGLHGEMAFTYKNPDRSTDPGAALPGAATLIVGARFYRREDQEPPEQPSGRIARYSWVDHYAPLRHALSAMADVLRAEGYRTRILADDNTLVDRAAAHRAGLGWFGKNANLLLPGRGSWFVLGSLLTDAALPVADRVVLDGCGSCVRCIDGCPTGAIVAPGVVDARRCLAWLAQRPGEFPEEFLVALGDRIYGCDDCQEVCPPNRTLDRREPPAPPDLGAQPWTSLVALVLDDDAAILSRHGRFYLPARDVNVLRRNALIALGNTVTPSTRGDVAPEVAAALEAGSASADAAVRHAATFARAAIAGRAAQMK
jgi:epoxyqueuosine reductase